MLKPRKRVGNAVKYGIWFSVFGIFFQAAYISDTLSPRIGFGVLAIICVVMEWRERRHSR